MSAKYKIRDIVVTTYEYGNKELIITDIVGDFYKVRSVGNKKNYTISEYQIEKVIGESTVDDSLCKSEMLNTERMRVFCAEQARLYPQESSKWKFLANLNEGDSICLVHRNFRFENAIFCGINPTKPIYPIRAKIKDRLHDFKLASMILPSIRD